MPLCATYCEAAASLASLSLRRVGAAAHRTARRTGRLLGGGACNECCILILYMQQMKYPNDAVPIELPQASAEVERGTPKLPRQGGSAARKSIQYTSAHRGRQGGGSLPRVKKTQTPTDSTHVDPFGNDACGSDAEGYATSRDCRDRWGRRGQWRGRGGCRVEPKLRRRAPTRCRAEPDGMQQKNEAHPALQRASAWPGVPSGCRMASFWLSFLPNRTP
jgi:hypothetical protein